MKITQEVFKNFITTLTAEVEPDTVQDDTFGEVESYILDDAILSYRVGDTKSFMGLSFEALGQSFHIIPTGEVLLEGEDDEDTMVVEDREFMQILEEFLKWRETAIKKMGI